MLKDEIRNTPLLIEPKKTTKKNDWNVNASAKEPYCERFNFDDIIITEKIFIRTEKIFVIKTKIPSLNIF